MLTCLRAELGSFIFHVDSHFQHQLVVLLWLIMALTTFACIYLFEFFGRQRHDLFGGFIKLFAL
jgi:hypothetical protein